MKQYSYDQADHLVAISAPGLTWSASYDGDGVRLGQVINGVPVTYTLDQAAPLVTVLAQEQFNNRKMYVYGLDDSPLARQDGAAWQYLSGRDALNSVRQKTNAEGWVVAARSFDPYGVVLGGDGGQPFGYGGEFRDSFVGLQALRARWYQPVTGRFVSRDQWPSDEGGTILLICGCMRMIDRP